MMLMGYWSCAVQPGTAMTAHGDDEVRRHKGCRTFLLRPRARRPSDPELPPRRSKSTYTLPHPPETARRQVFSAGINILLALIGLLISAGPALSENASDWITGLPREPIHVQAWPKGKKVAVCFILYVEVWGFGHGPNFRPDTAARDPDVVDESFHQYAAQRRELAAFRHLSRRRDQ